MTTTTTTTTLKTQLDLEQQQQQPQQQQEHGGQATSSKEQCKFILVTGGVISGIGKGVIASSTGLLLRTQGLRVTSIKIDPYLNIDAGTLTPLDHGVYVCVVCQCVFVSR